MAVEARLEHSNLTAGELSPWLRNRTNLDRYANGVKVMRNFVIIPEGGSTRRPGSRFILPQKTEGAIGALIPFRFSGSDSYMLVLNGGAIRFLRAGGFVLSGPNPYEVAMPWAAADIPNVRWAQEGNAAWLPCRGHEPRKLVRGASHTDWTLSPYRPTGGPVKPQNLDIAKTIVASAVTGNGIALLGVGTNFQAGHVGSVWRLDESDLSLVPNWKANEAITIPTETIPAAGATNLGDMTGGGGLAAAFDGSPGSSAFKGAATDAYVGRSYSTPTSIASVRIQGTMSAGGFPPFAIVRFSLYRKNGGAPANSTDGVKLAELATGTASSVDVSLNSSDTTSNFDVLWVQTSAISANNVSPVDIAISELTFTRFITGGTPVLRRYNGNVYQALAGTNTGFAPPVHVEGDVLSENGGVIWRYRHGPSGFVRITAVADALHATADVLTILPDSVVSRPTYRWFEGAWNAIDGWPEKVQLIDRGLFFSRGKDWWVTSVDNDNDFEVTTLPDSAISQSLRSRDGSLPIIEWVLDNGVIVLGCRDNEIIIRAPATFEALTGFNARAPVGSKKGSAPHVPAALEDGVIFIGRSRRRLFFAAFDPDTQKLEPSEVSIAGRHLLKGKAAGLGWQPDPWNVLWGYCQDGSLFGLTFNTEHKIAGMHSHPLVNGSVEDVKSIPSSDEGVNDVYMIVRRTINNVTRRYVEQLGPYFEDVDGTAKGAWFFDCAVSYSGPPVTTVIAAHLAGQQVGILADGAAHKRITLNGAGQGTLDRAASDIVLGLPIDARIIDLPRNINLPTGSTKGQKKKASHALIDLVETIGGAISCNGGRAEALELTGAANYGAAPELFTGSKRKQLGGPLGDEAELTISASDGMPMTVSGLGPELDVVED